MTIPTPTLLDRFCRYVRIDTQADEGADDLPQLARASSNWAGCSLARAEGHSACATPKQDEHGIVLATVPATVTPAADHRLDRPRRHLAGNHRQERQADRALATTTAATSSCPATRRKVIRVADNPGTARMRRARRSSPPTARRCSAADDKAGVAVIMETAAYLAAAPGDSARADPRLLHLRRGDRPRRRSRRSEEARRRGRLHARRRRPRARSTARPSPPTWPSSRSRGVNIHPSIAKGRMVNAVRLAGLFLDRLPRATLSPETTERPRGLPAPYRIEGGVAETTAAHPAARLRHGEAGREGRAAANGRAGLIEAEYPGSEDRREGRRRSIATWPTA